MYVYTYTYIYIYVYINMPYVMCSAQPVHELSTRCQTCMRRQERPESLRLTCLPEWCGVARFGTHNKQKQTSAARARQGPVRGSSACLRQRLGGTDCLRRHGSRRIHHFVHRLIGEIGEIGGAMGT